MSRQPRTILVLGGIRSGKSEYAEALVADAASVRYIATANEVADDAEWSTRLAAHRERRPSTWVTEEIGKAPEDLATLIAGAAASETILVDDIGGWLTALLERAADASGSASANANVLTTAVEALALAAGTTEARLVLVSPEVGLSVIPATQVGRAFADACGSVNRALATACDGVALVIAGQPTWIKATAGRLPANEVIAPAARRTGRSAVPATDFDLEVPEGANPITIGMSLPLPDATAANDAVARLDALPVPGAGLGAIAAGVAFAAGAQGTVAPAAFASIRVIQVHAVHLGELGAGEDRASAAERLDATRAGESPLARLAAEADATVEIIDTGEAQPVEDGDVCTAEEVETAMLRGWVAANAAADRGNDLIVLAASGPGVDAAAAGLVALLTLSEVPLLLGRVWDGAGRINDDAWMQRCIALRDATLRVRAANGADAPTSLAAIGGPALATAAGVLLGAASRRTPVLLDGPVGVAAALAARDYAAQTRMWCLLTDHGNQPTVRTAADMLGLTPLVDLHIGLGEGCNALAILPLLQSALAISSAVAPAPSPEPSS